MRKRLISADTSLATSTQADWVGMESSAEAEATSEHPEFPLASAFGVTHGEGWQAAQPGPQTIRLRFDHPTQVRRIHLEFREEECERTQEFLLRWSADGGKTYRDILRQQYVFNSSAKREVEDYQVNLEHATVLELQINPDLARRQSHASLYRLQIA